MYNSYLKLAWIKRCIQDQLDKGEQGLEEWMEKLRRAPKEIVHRTLKDLYRHHYGVDEGEYYWYLEQIEDEDEVTENELTQIRKELLWAKDDDERERRRNRAAGEEEEKLLKSRTMYEALALYFERRKRKQRICSLVLIILTLVFIVPFALASIYVTFPFVNALGFRDNKCHVVNVTDVSDQKRDDCFEVFVQYTDHDFGTNVTTLLHLDEINLDNKCLPEKFLPNCTTLEPLGSCSIDCLYNPSNYDQTIEHRKFNFLDVLGSAASVIPSLTTLISLGLYTIYMRVNKLRHRQNYINLFHEDPGDQ